MDWSPRLWCQITHLTITDESRVCLFVNCLFVCHSHLALSLLHGHGPYDPLLASMVPHCVTSTPSHIHPTRLVSLAENVTFCVRSDAWRIEIHQAGGVASPRAGTLLVYVNNSTRVVTRQPIETRNALDCEFVTNITPRALFSPTYLLNLIQVEIAPFDPPCMWVAILW